LTDAVSVTALQQKYAARQVGGVRANDVIVHLRRWRHYLPAWQHWRINSETTFLKRTCIKINDVNSVLTLL
jgi:hypothetical protein